MTAIAPKSAVVPDTSSVNRFYAAALLGLRRLDDAAVPRPRFDADADADADARWTQLAGHLTTSHRIDLLLRDATGRFGPAFHAAQVFGLRGLASDEPFGPSWSALQPQEAQDLWNATRAAPRREGEALLAAFGEALGIAAPPSSSAPLPPLAPGERVIAVGGRAAWRVARSALGAQGVEWSDQVRVLVATPAERQFAGLCATLGPAARPTPLLEIHGFDDAAADALRRAMPRLDRIVLSRDAAPAGKHGAQGALDAADRAAAEDALVARLTARYPGAVVVD